MTDNTNHKNPEAAKEFKALFDKMNKEGCGPNDLQTLVNIAGSGDIEAMKEMCLYLLDWFISKCDCEHRADHRIEKTVAQILKGITQHVFDKQTTPK